MDAEVLYDEITWVDPVVARLVDEGKIRDTRLFFGMAKSFGNVTKDLDDHWDITANVLGNKGRHECSVYLEEAEYQKCIHIVFHALSWVDEDEEPKWFEPERKEIHEMAKPVIMKVIKYLANSDTGSASIKVTWDGMCILGYNNIAQRIHRDIELE